jgi:Tat protein translocase TatB subunit
MFDIGFSEILLILGLALVVLGPEKLPQVARTMGRWAGRARAMARQFRDQLENEADEIKDNLSTNIPAPAAAPTTAPPGATPHTVAPPTVDEFAARDAATTPEAMHANDRPT